MEVYTQKNFTKEIDTYNLPLNDLDFVLSFVKSLNIENNWWGEVALACMRYEDDVRPHIAYIRQIFRVMLEE